MAHAVSCFDSDLQSQTNPINEGGGGHKYTKCHTMTSSLSIVSHCVRSIKGVLDILTNGIALFISWSYTHTKSMSFSL